MKIPKHGSLENKRQPPSCLRWHHLVDDIPANEVITPEASNNHQDDGSDKEVEIFAPPIGPVRLASIITDSGVNNTDNNDGVNMINKEGVTSHDIMGVGALQHRMYAPVMVGADLQNGRLISLPGPWWCQESKHNLW